MAKPATGAKAPPFQRKFGLNELWRTAIWGFCAAFALLVVTYAATSDIGQDRLQQTAADVREFFHPSGIKPPRPLDAQEGRQLAEIVRRLTADRDQLVADNGRLMSRIASLERSVDDVTGSIARAKAAQAAAQIAAQNRPDSAPVTAPPAAAPMPPAAEDTTSSIGTPVPPPPSLPPGKFEYGLDLGSATTIEGARALWTLAHKRYGAQIEGLQPIVQLRDRARLAGSHGPAGVELRLIVGPLPNAATAARYCATLAAAGATCKPAPLRRPAPRLALIAALVSSMALSLHRPSLRQAIVLAVIAAAALTYGFVLRYQIIENATIGVGCDSDGANWMCASRRTAIALYTPEGFGIVALGAALLNLLRPSIVFWAIALAAGCAGIVLYNAALSALAAGLLLLSLARPVPEAS